MVNTDRFGIGRTAVFDILQFCGTAVRFAPAITSAIGGITRDLNGEKVLS
jgi:hypothetical protein